MSLTLTSSIKEINKVGAVTARQLKNLNIETVVDLLNYYPFRYDDFSVVTPVNALKAGINANIVGHIELIQNKRSPRQRINITEALISDDTGSVKAIWFNQPFIGRSLQAGDKVSLSGQVAEDYSGAFLKSPNHEKIGQGQGTHTQGLVPNYHLTAGLTQKQLRFLISQVINFSDKLVDWLPDEIKNSVDLVDLKDAIRNIHFPQNKEILNKARIRLSFNELFLIQLQAQLNKQEFLEYIAEPIKFLEKETKEFVKNLPFELTKDQKIATWKILQDLKKTQPMARLLEGDVGSGKTIVAVITMLNVALSKKQSALMVPTEILAKQHFNSICELLKNTKIKIGLITSSEKKLNYEKDDKKRKNAELIVQDADIVIGTHSLIQESIKFKDLSLAIIDEQHRFGVYQRKELIERSGHKKTSPHLLSMTATPIPRSLALALYGDLDISIIHEMPKGRKKIITQVVLDKEREACYKFVQENIQEGRQVFVVCPLIDVSDKLGFKSVKEEFEKLNNVIFKDLEIAMLHGRMKSKEKEKIMQEFLDNKIKILVSTSVIEVGVDIPNANIMIIEGADRFGLAGSSGRIYKWDGIDWSLVSTPVSDNLNGVFALSSFNAWAVGENGTILYWDNVNWTEVDNPNIDDFYDVEMVSLSLGWVIGIKGVVNLYRETEDIVPPTGTLISSAFDMGTSSAIQIIEWDEYIPPTCNPISACSISLQVRAAPDAGGVPGTWTSWYGANGIDTYFTESRGTLIPNDLNWNQWVQYKVVFTSDEVEAPVVYEVRLNYK